MRKFTKVVPFLLFTLMLAMVWMPAAQAVQSQGGQPQSPAAQTQAEQIVQGQLVSVDMEKSTFTVKLSDNQNIQFAFDSNTKVAGSSAGVQGLSSETGTQLAVHYTQQDNGPKMATTIEILK